MEFSITRQQAAIVPAERIVCAQGGIRRRRVRYACTKQINSRHLEARSARLPAKSGTGKTRQSRSQHLSLFQARRNQSPRLAVNLAAFPNGANAGH